VIADDDRVASRPIVSVSVVDVTAAEDGTEAGAFAITRTGATAGSLSVPFTVAGRATLGADYALSAASPAVIPAGAAWVRITVTGLQDGLVEGDESIVLAASPGATWQLAGQASAELTLTDDEAPAPVPGLALAVAPLARGGSLAATLAAGPSGGAFALWLAAAPAYVPFAGGVFLLDPSALLPLAAGALDPGGAALVRAGFPDAPELLGAVLFAQAAAIQPSPPALLFSASAARRVD
jgi:hypothetical protein